MRGPIIPIAGFQAQKGEAFREIARDITEAGYLQDLVPFSYRPPYLF